MWSCAAKANRPCWNSCGHMKKPLSWTRLPGSFFGNIRTDRQRANSFPHPNGRLRKPLDRIPFPARALLPNESYIRYGKKKYGYSITTVMSTRGCPFRCEFCSNVVFGGSYRERSPENVVDEIDEVLALGYDRISFTDDVFTMKKERVIKVCQEIRRRGLTFQLGMPGPGGCPGYSDRPGDESSRLHAHLLWDRIR